MWIVQLSLYPHQNEPAAASGVTHVRSGIGHTFLSKAPHIPAMAALHKTSFGRHFGERLTTSGKLPKRIIGTLMRNWTHRALAYSNQGEAFDPVLHRT
ncbi:hypothetical protein [Herminiimonas sp. CN]|uniref:hypothetical protein n=1 Tax=Herminiimonas sp. CN TaxID=1349818 RepID=UPI0012DF423F|nr:hypothetical protein [Herminiimonas sp. CN]